MYGEMIVALPESETIISHHLEELVDQILMQGDSSWSQLLEGLLETESCHDP